MNVHKTELGTTAAACRRALSLTDNLKAMHRLTNSNFEALNRFRMDELFEDGDGTIRVTISGRLRVAHEALRPLSYDTRIVCDRPHYAAAHATVRTSNTAYEWLATASMVGDGGDARRLKMLAEERALDGALRMAGVGLDYPGEIQNCDWDLVWYEDDTCAV